jgi:hypothetical protein
MWRQKNFYKGFFQLHQQSGATRDQRIEPRRCQQDHEPDDYGKQEIDTRPSPEAEGPVDAGICGMVQTVTDRDPVSGFIAIAIHAVKKNAVLTQLKEDDRVGGDPQRRPETIVPDKGHRTDGKPGPGQP